MLKPQDIVVLLKLVGSPSEWTFEGLAADLSMSVSAVHRSLSRASEAGLYEPQRRRVIPPALYEFLVHAAKYLFPPVMAGEARGMPTAWGAPPLAARVSSEGGGMPVWPDARGDARGIAMTPIHPKAPLAARSDESLWELLALVDALRLGDARHREEAAHELAHRLEVPVER